jgi:hypothetical protein
MNRAGDCAKLDVERNRRPTEGRTMATAITEPGLDRGSAERAQIHAWRAERLRELGVPAGHAELYADVVDWHLVADLVARGCMPTLALRIVL